MVAHCHCQQKKRRIEDPSPGSEIPDTVPSDNLILLSEEEADIYHAELSPEENRRTVQQVLLEASAGLLRTLFVGQWLASVDDTEQRY